MLQQHVVTHRVDERPQSLRLAYSSLASQYCPRPRECFLANVLDRRRKTESSTEFEFNQGAEILDEVPLCPRVSRAQSLQIQCIKSVEFHWLFASPRQHSILGSTPLPLMERISETFQFFSVGAELCFRRRPPGVLLGFLSFTVVGFCGHVCDQRSTAFSMWGGR